MNSSDLDDDLHGIPASASCDRRERIVAAIGIACCLLLAAALAVAAFLAPPPPAAVTVAVADKAGEKPPEPEPPKVPATAEEDAPPQPIVRDKANAGGSGGLGGGRGRARDGDGPGAAAFGTRTSVSGETVDDAPGGRPDTPPGTVAEGAGTADTPEEPPAVGFTVEKKPEPPPPPPAPPVGVPDAKDGAGKAGGGTEFLGITTKAESVVFVLDYSSSMRSGISEDESGNKEDKFERLQKELAHAVQTLGNRARFTIILFGGSVKAGEPFVRLEGKAYPQETTPAGATVCLSDGIATGAAPLIGADEGGKRRAIGWIKGREPHPESQSEPVLAMERALLAKPKAIYLLTDGEFSGPSSGELQAIVARLNADKATEIHTIAFGSLGDIFTLEEIAKANNGKYRRIEFK